MFLFVKIKSGKLEPHDVWVKLLLVNLEFVVVLLRFYSLPPDIYMTSTTRHNDGIHTNSIQHSRFPVIDQNMIDVFPLSSNIWLTNKHFSPINMVCKNVYMYIFKIFNKTSFAFCFKYLKRNLRLLQADLKLSNFTIIHQHG